MGTTNCLFGEDQELLFCQNLGYLHALCVCVCVFKGYFVFTPNEISHPFSKIIKEISKAPSVYLFISKEKMYMCVCVCVYTEAYMCIHTCTHTQSTHCLWQFKYVGHLVRAGICSVHSEANLLK